MLQSLPLLVYMVQMLPEHAALCCVQTIFKYDDPRSLKCIRHLIL